MRLFSICCLLLLVTGSAFAQSDIDPQRYYPLELRNLWVYEHYNGSYSSGGTAPLVGYIQREVVRDTVIGGEDYTLIEEVKYDLDLGLVHTGLCAVRATEEEFQQEVVRGSCFRMAFSYFIGSESYDVEVEIGEISYTADAEHFYGYSQCQGGTSCSSGGSNYVTDIGPLRSFSSSSTYYPCCGWSYHTDRKRLHYAEVGGEVYGVNPVDAEETSQAGEAGFTLGAAYPNPFESATTVTMGLAAPARVRVEVMDVLGRRVLTRDLGVQSSGLSLHRLDLAALPAGLYVLRTTTSSGETATRRITKVER